MLRKIPYILLLLFIFNASSCTFHHFEMPFHDKGDIEELLRVLSRVSVIEAVLSLEYEKYPNSLQGDASLFISEKDLELKIYYLGFSVGYLKETNGFIESSYPLDRGKIKLMIEGLRNCFFWWKIDDYIIKDEEEFFVIRNYNRRVYISKKEMLPAKQVIYLDNGDQLVIQYERPAKIDFPNEVPNSLPSWYQSRMKIQLNNHLLRIKIDSYNLTFNANNSYKGIY